MLATNANLYHVQFMNNVIRRHVPKLRNRADIPNENEYLQFGVCCLASGGRQLYQLANTIAIKYLRRIFTVRITEENSR